MTDKAALYRAAGAKMFHHIDGVAIGSTVDALARAGVLPALAAARAPLAVDALAAAHGLRRGYLRLAIKLLAAQGFVERVGDIAGGAVAAALTPTGRDWLRHAPGYAAVPALLEMGLALMGAAPPDRLAGEAWRRVAATRPEEATAMRVWLHLCGAPVAAAMSALFRWGAFPALAEGCERARLSGDPVRLAAALDILESQGWALGNGGAVRLTPEGLCAAELAPQYLYPTSYLPTFLAVPCLLAGEPVFAAAGAEPGPERHVDRTLDIAFSGLVFERSCREPFLSIALPIFDSEPITAQPTCVVDTGSGDGTLLHALFTAVKERTRRGAALAAHPLTMIGAEYNRVAQDATARRLTEAQIPFMSVQGDIGDPAGLARTLASLGIEMRDALHVSKSVIHNRRFRPPRRRAARPRSTAVFVAPDGDPLDAADLEADLVEHFIRWRPWTRRHGMIAIEAHTVDPVIVAAHAGRNLFTSLDACHGYSHQYLVEIEVHRAAAAAAGYRTCRTLDLGAQMVGRPAMSIDHLVPVGSGG